MGIDDSYEHARRESERRNAQSKFIEHFPTEAKPGQWRVSSRLRPNWQAFSTSDRLDRPVREGERFRARTALQVHVLTHWQAPFTGGADATLPEGAVLRATEDQPPGVPGFNCVPDDYDALEPVLVPESDRLAEKYGGFSLSFVLDDIGPQLESISGSE